MVSKSNPNTNTKQITLIIIVTISFFSLLSALSTTTYVNAAETTPTSAPTDTPKQIFEQNLNIIIEGNYSDISKAWIKTKSDNALIKFFDSANIPPIIPPPIEDNNNKLNLTNKIVFGGDSDAGKSIAKDIASLIINANPEAIYILGDLTYGNGPFLYKTPITKVVRGNHDDNSLWGGVKINYAENKDYYFDSFSLSNNKTLWIYGLNTAQPTSNQVEFFKQNNPNLKNNDIVILIGHHPNDMYLGHHVACEDNSCNVTNPVLNNLPGIVEIKQIYAHEHALAYKTDNNYFISGGLGRNLYDGNAIGDWKVKIDYGFLTFDLDTENFQFYDKQGKEILN